jgi:hypothetical protein
MSVVNAAITGAAFFAGITFSVNADAACRADTGECQRSSQYFAARSNPTATSTSSNITLPEVTVFGPRPRPGYYMAPYVNAFGYKTMAEHYQVPADFDANVQLHPYTSGLGPWPGPAKHRSNGPIVKTPSHYNGWPWISGRPDARGEFANGAAPALSR